MSTTTYPVRVDARRDRDLSRWLWLVKWFLAIPHYIVLGFLWLTFVVLSAVAFFAILFTGRYPRAIFDFNVGVLRWTWRVVYYSYGALGTDQYPPFSLGEEPGYPARLEIDYPQHLSRGLVLVKWWLLAIPQYIVVGLFAGGGTFAGWELGNDNLHWPAGGLIGILVLVAAVLLLFTGRYPDSLFDFILGMNRWVLRVSAYAGLMTDKYPPFRLDLGGPDPGGTLALRTATAPPAPSAPSAPWAEPDVTDVEHRPANDELGAGASGEPGRGGRGWTAGRIVSVVVGSVLAITATGFWAGAAGLAWAGQANRHDGYVTTTSTSYASGGYALATDTISLPVGGWDWLGRNVVGQVRIRVTSQDQSRPVFVGIAPASAVNNYLAGVSYTTLTDIGGAATTVQHAGTALPAAIGGQPIWVAKASGSGTQALTWTPRGGDWAVVVMNSDVSPGVAVRADVGATLPWLGWLVAGLAVIGLLLAVGGVLMIAVSVRRASTADVGVRR